MVIVTNVLIIIDILIKINQIFNNIHGHIYQNIIRDQ